jgi:hypothetical protein
VTEAAEEELRKLLKRFGPAEVGPAVGPRSGGSLSAVLLREVREGVTYYHRSEMSTEEVAMLFTTLVNTARDMLQELAHLRQPHRAGTLAWAAASGRPFYRPCWVDLVCEQRKHDTTGLVAYPPARPEFWWYFRPSVHDVTATDYVLL